jgi:hypothetical protein
MSAPVWLAALQPVGQCVLRPLRRGSDVLAWQATVEFVRWSAPPDAVPLPWHVTYGKTPIIGQDGQQTVAEIELVRRLREAGWRAGWVDRFGAAPTAWARWIVQASTLPSPLRASYEAIADHAGSSGVPDVIAWRGESLGEAVFVEHKGPSDRIRSGQEAWLRAARQIGMSPDQFAVAKWPGLTGCAGVLR